MNSFGADFLKLFHRRLCDIEEGIRQRDGFDAFRQSWVDDKTQRHVSAFSGLKGLLGKAETLCFAEVWRRLNRCHRGYRLSHHLLASFVFGIEAGVIDPTWVNLHLVDLRLELHFHVLIEAGDKLLNQYTDVAQSISEVFQGISVSIDQGAFDEIFKL